jgi:dienelactone hydrolase
MLFDSNEFRRKDWQEQFFKLLGGDPLVTVAPQYEDTVTEHVKGILIKKIQYQVDAQEISAYLLMPEVIEGVRPGVIALHAHGSRWHIGKNEMVGKAGPEELAFGIDLVKRGFVVIAPDLPGFGDRMLVEAGDATGATGFQQLQNRILIEGKTYLYQALRELSAALSILLALPIVDATRVATLGFSFGGRLAAQLAAVDTRVACVVAHCCIGSIQYKMEHHIKLDATEIIPDFLQIGEVPALLSCIAPRPFLISSTSSDKYCADSKAVYTGIAQVWDNMGAAHSLALHEYSAGHEVTQIMKEQMYEWLEDIFNLDTDLHTQKKLTQLISQSRM